MRKSPYDLAWKAEAKLTRKDKGKNLGIAYARLLIRTAWAKGHKAGMARQRRINLNKEFYKRMRLINENIAKAMG